MNILHWQKGILERSLQKGLNPSGILIGFIILIVTFLGLEYIFKLYYNYYKLYNFLDREVMPVIYFFIILLAQILASIFMLVRYKFIPLFIKKSFKDSVMISVAGVVILWFMNFFFVMHYGSSSGLPFMQAVLSLKPPYFYISMIMIVIFNPLAEEFLMRGFFFEILVRKWNAWIALIVTLLLTTITHYSVAEQLVAVICYDVVLCFLYLEGGILASFIGHMFINYYALYLLNS